MYLVLIHIIPKEHSLVLADIKEQVNIHTFFTPSYCNPIKVDMLETVLSPQVRLTAANTLKIAIDDVDFVLEDFLQVSTSDVIKT